MRPLSPDLQQVIRRLLTQEFSQSGGKVLDSAQLTDAVARVYDQFAYRLTPMISNAGVLAILTRSAKLTQAEFPFVKSSPSVNSAPSHVWEDFNRQEPALVSKASEALLTTFAGLVAGLIGDRLAWRLLFDLTPEVFSNAPPPERTK
jgi:hypothetical protein